MAYIMAENILKKIWPLPTTPYFLLYSGSLTFFLLLKKLKLISQLEILDLLLLLP